MHKSQVFLYALIAFVAGVGLRSFFVIDMRLAAFVAGVGAFCAACWFFEQQKTRVGILSVLLIAFSFGIARFSWHAAARDEATILAYADTREVMVRGIVADVPDIREKNTRLTVEAREVFFEGMPHTVHGHVLLFAARYPEFAYGDEVTARGTLVKPEPFSDFDYPAYLSKNDIYALMYYPDIAFVSSGNGTFLKTALFRIKQSFERGIERAVPEPHAAFLKGILLGSRAGIPAWLFDAFRATGVVHIIALSGFNVTIIADTIFRVLRRLHASPHATFWISCSVILLFTIMVGASPSIVRSSLMGCVVLLTRRIGRQYQGTRALVMTGAAMVLYNPAVLRFDVAFQLSFLATAGLLFVAPRIERRFRFVPAYGGIRENLVTTIAAQLTVLPLLVYYFGEVSIVSPVSNLLVLSLMPLTMFAGFVSAIAGMIWAPMGMLFGSAAYLLVTYHIAVVSLLSRIPFASLFVSVF